MISSRLLQPAVPEQLPLDALKIDKSFIDAIDTESATSPVTPHIIDMAKELGLWVVAEGVETEAQLAYLHARKVEFAQGWLFSAAATGRVRGVPPQAAAALWRGAEHMQNPRSVPIEREGVE